MLKTGLRICRSHPILAAAGIGAISGAVNAVFLEIGGLRHRAMTGVLPFLFSGSHTTQMTALQVALLLLIEIAGNVLGFALVFATPIALVVGIRRLLGRRRSEPLSESGDS